MTVIPATDRRGFLKAAGSITLAFAIPAGDALAQAAALAGAKPKLPGDMETNRKLGSWLRIGADGAVTLLVGKVELGQGILTAVTQICADELDVDIGRVKLISGDTAQSPNEGTTAGSFSMPNCAPAVRQAAAEVRALLIEMAAAKTGKPAEGWTVADGAMSGPDGAKASYWELASGLSLEREATGAVKPKNPADYKYVGKEFPRLDFPGKFTGQAMFVQELRPEGLLFGQVVRPPTYKAKLTALDTSAAEKMPGVVKVVKNGSFVGVVAQREEQAVAAAAALAAAAKWEVEKALPTSDGIFDWLQKTKPAKVIETKKQPRNGGDPAVKTLEATYFRPYHMHGSIGTSAAVAVLGADGVMTIDTHSQSVFETSEAIAMMLGVDKSKVRCRHVQGSGCYGHNMADDAAADAALLAAAVPGRPVKLQYTREQEHRWEPYGSAMVIKTKAGVDKDGNVLDWDLELFSTPHGTRPGSHAGNLLSARYLEKPFEMPTPQNGGPPNYAADRNGIALYDFPGHNVLTNFITDMPVRVSSTRGLGAYANVFAIESFMDELARAAGVDPIQYRLRHLKDPRGRDVIAKAAETFGWDKWQKKDGRGRGIGFAKYKNIAGYCAVALEVEVNKRNGRVRVVRAVAAADSGHLVNPDGVRNQIEGGLIQSLSWTLKEEVKFDDTRVTSEDWVTYPILTFADVPPVEVVLIDRPGAPFLGTGEAAQGPTGAALANAVADATGVRFRRGPFTPERVKAGLTA
ncbi:molybdopterin-dependent oxidoreductase [Alsobacter sp. SYSU M60028]|uniref:Molybdopterin-dependent oxidoreductase n=1 Tax=Alsobacter ponti TaxID=2962936 RepID=A0ABT1LCW2_9HYPH|nr:molybdopterin cofactor-binding domain-containing protein [Alsobacter ponti]MCP8939304.1 molybdopterin-dependent oxidoreductase [Alsobacter ponti]